LAPGHWWRAIVRNAWPRRGAREGRYGPNCASKSPRVHSFVYATREDAAFEALLGLLNDANRAWAADAGALVALFSKRTLEHNGEEAATRSFDTGAAWQNFALEATRRGLAVHPMAGFDWGSIHDALDVPAEEFDVEEMVAVGERADPEILPEELQEREQPSDRKSLDELTFRGSFD